MSEPSAESRRDRHAVRHAQGTLLCPRCDIPLRGSDHALGIAWRCGACGGQSLNFSQFRRLVPEQGANDIWLQATVRPLAPRRPTACPECQAGMDAVHIPLRGTLLELDLCRLCQRLWLDQPVAEPSEPGSLAVAVSTPAVARPRRWFGKQPPSAPDLRSRGEAMFSLLEHQADRAQEYRSNRGRTWVTIAGIIGGALLLGLSTRGSSSDVNFRIAASGAALLFYGILRLRHG